MAAPSDYELAAKLRALRQIKAKPYMPDERIQYQEGEIAPPAVEAATPQNTPDYFEQKEAAGVTDERSRMQKLMDMLFGNKNMPRK